MSFKHSVTEVTRREVIDAAHAARTETHGSGSTPHWFLRRLSEVGSDTPTYALHLRDGKGEGRVGTLVGEVWRNGDLWVANLPNAGHGLGSSFTRSRAVEMLLRAYGDQP